MYIYIYVTYVIPQLEVELFSGRFPWTNHVFFVRSPRMVSNPEIIKL